MISKGSRDSKGNAFAKSQMTATVMLSDATLSIPNAVLHNDRRFVALAQELLGSDLDVLLGESAHLRLALANARSTQLDSNDDSITTQSTV